nr:ABC-ATPase domain-containing protein [Spirochaetota bacterium]
MNTVKDLTNKLAALDGRGYKAYKEIQGAYQYPDFSVIIDHVQGDPYAAPSRVRAIVPMKTAMFPEDTFHTRPREIALRDYITRQFALACKQVAGKTRGTGKSGLIEIDRPRQEVLERTSAFVRPDEVELRFVMGLPAFGRKIAGRHAAAMFGNELPRIVSSSVFYRNLNSRELYHHITTVEDAEWLRQELPGKGLVAFVADGAILPRRTGIDPRPMAAKDAVPFRSPETFRTSFTLPNHGEITGMGIPEGITLIAGGGYHGKSTLLNALEMGIYNHVPGDGREFAVTVPAAVKIRAEDGRRIEKTCITPFIKNLPFRRDTDAFSSDDASGSTSQSANIIEAMETGTELLLIDEDTSATNFMIRDHRMQELVAKEREPITPFIDMVRHLYNEHRISTILVIGGAGDYFDVADSVIAMNEYLPEDMTAQARAIAEKYRAERKAEGGTSFGAISPRILRRDSFDAGRGKHEVKISPKGLQTIAFGTHSIDLGA